MATYRIELTDEEARRIQELARKSGLEPEEFIRRGVSRWLRVAGDDFTQAANYVLKKNSELYDRLS